MAHSNLVGGSSAARVINCPASLMRSRELIAVDTATPSPYAAEGTTMHQCMELIVNGEAEPFDFLGVEILGVVVTQDHINDLIMPALSAVDAFMNEFDVLEYQTEATASFKHPERLRGAFGTMDLCGKLADGRPFILDYKFGYGLEVTAKDNYQLLFYAAAALADDAMQWLFEGNESGDIILGIIQPTFSGEVDMTVVNVDDLRAMTLTLQASIHDAFGPYPKVSTGDHCRWCPAAPYCPEHQDMAGYALSLDPTAKDTISEALAIADQVIAWAKKVKEHAHVLLEHGETIKDWKLVKKRATRAWADADKALDTFKRTRSLKIDDYCDMKLKSPPQLEKVCKAKGLDFDKYSSLIVAESFGTTLAPADDPRPAVTIAGPRVVPENLKKLQETA